jgi:hypothetical protein
MLKLLILRRKPGLAHRHVLGVVTHRDLAIRAWEKTWREEKAGVEGGNARGREAKAR